MRLLNTSSINLEEFIGENVPDYVILSHTWGDDEVTFQDLLENSHDLHEKGGYKKIQSCCNQAIADGFEYAWVDTCCIDKTSSSELSEAINSMFRWYRNAQICYAYLNDVPDDEDHQSEDSAFRRSRWFTRGWTLQEMLAPLSVTFFGRGWVDIGTKASLREAISDVTDIETQILSMNYTGEISVAQRMSWASKRETTRVEDLAYCLMGLFGINMSLLYGEGENAFVRLQLEIIKSSDDQSIFAWTGAGKERGFLARSPSEFINCGDIRQIDTGMQSQPYEMTNKGLRIQLPMKWILPGSSYYERPRVWGSVPYVITLAILGCQREKTGEFKMLAIRLQKREGEGGGYVRVSPDKIEDLEALWIRRAEMELLYVQENSHSAFELSQWMHPQTLYVFSVPKTALFHASGHSLSDISPRDLWTGQGEGKRLALTSTGTTGGLMFESKAEGGFAVMLGIKNHMAWCDVVPKVGDETIDDIRNSYGGDSNEAGEKPQRLVPNRDRISAALSESTSVFVAIRRKKVSSEISHLVEIEVTTKGNDRQPIAIRS